MMIGFNVLLMCGEILKCSTITKNFSCITHTVEHNSISSSSTLRLQLHVSALYVGHLQVVTYRAETCSCSPSVLLNEI